MGNSTSVPVFIGGALENCCGGTKNKSVENDNVNGQNQGTIEGSVVLKKKNSLDRTDITAHFVDSLDEWFGKRVSVQLISATYFDPANPKQGRLVKAAYIENWSSTLTSAADVEDATLDIKFEWDNSMGFPDAFLIKNHHHYEFYLKTLFLENVPGHQGPVHFVCNSWVYPAHRYSYDRVFFANTRDTHEWTSDERALEAFNRFSTKLVEIEEMIVERNNDRRMRNRYGPAKVPYTLLYPCTSDPKIAQGLTGMGIPNSVSI